MNILIVESNEHLGELWKGHLERQDCACTLVRTEDEAIAALQKQSVNVIVMDVVLSEGSALSVADFASYRQPDAKIVFVTNTSFFSDGSIFRHASNACAFLRTETSLSDLTAVVEHYGNR